jgi:hypothetical protein
MNIDNNEDKLNSSNVFRKQSTRFNTVVTRTSENNLETLNYSGFDISFEDIVTPRFICRDNSKALAEKADINEVKDSAIVDSNYDVSIMLTLSQG